jgi:hypothetical protein
MNPIFEFLDGKHYTHNDVSGTLRHETLTHHTGFVENRLMHHADKKGQQCTAYRKTREKLGDDYVTDLTNDIEGYCVLARIFGYVDAKGN